MNLAELRTFLAIIDTGSLARAAAQLNVTQSTVTTRLKTLEQGLGQTLINRNKAGAALTPAGERLRRYARTISDLWQQAQQETSLPGSLSTVCNIGCSTDLWSGLGQRFFDHVRLNHRDVGLSMWYGGPRDLDSWLSAGLIDVAISHVPRQSQQQTVYDLVTDDLILVSTDPLPPVRPNAGYVFIEAGEAFGRDHAVAFADASSARISFGSADLGLAYLRCEGGSAYLPRRMVQTQLEAGELFCNPGAPVFQRRSYVVVNRATVAQWPWFDAALVDMREAGRGLV